MSVKCSAKSCLLIPFKFEIFILPIRYCFSYLYCMRWSSVSAVDIHVSYSNDLFVHNLKEYWIQSFFGVFTFICHQSLRLLLYRKHQKAAKPKICLEGGLLPEKFLYELTLLTIVLMSAFACIPCMHHGFLSFPSGWHLTLLPSDWVIQTSRKSGNLTYLTARWELWTWGRQMCFSICEG